MRTVIILIGGLIVFSNSFSQVEKNKTDYQLFNTGIYLENLNVTIPWGTPFENLKEYGHPKLEVAEKRNSLVWDSVKILNGISAILYFYPYSGKNHNFFAVTGVVDSINAVNFKKIIINNLGRPNKTVLRNTGKTYGFSWKIKNFIFITLVHKKEWAEKSRILIQRL